MNKPFMTVHEMAHITGTTPRTLHHYDRIGLLKPAALTDKRYRLYDRDKLEKLQLILFLKETGAGLRQIADLLELPPDERKVELDRHREHLQRKKERLDEMIRSFDRYREAGSLFGPNLDRELARSGPPLRQQYEREAEIVYGDTPAYRQYRGRMDSLEPAERQQESEKAERRMESVFRELFALRGEPIESAEVEAGIERWRQSLEPYVSGDAGLLACIGDTYADDGRFRAYFDGFGGASGQFSDFLRRAIALHCRRRPVRSGQTSANGKLPRPL